MQGKGGGEICKAGSVGVGEGQVLSDYHAKCRFGQVLELPGMSQGAH